MTAAIPDALLQQFSDFVAARMGLHFPPPRWPDMVRGLARAAPDFGHSDPEACMRSLLAAPPTRPHVEILASHLTVGETSFFRDPAAFAALEQVILPDLIAAGRASGRRLRIWSAGCCTGEEPYSLAILLTRLIPDLDDWNLTVLATDINPRFLERAALGEYHAWSFRGAPPWVRDGCFTRCGGDTFTIRERLRRLVSFDYLNLVDDVYPSLASNTNGIDLVVCRNVLMYFDDNVRRAVTDRLQRCVREGGWLLPGPNEAPAESLRGWSPVEYPGAVLFRKGPPGKAPVPVHEPGPPTVPLDETPPTPQPARPAPTAPRPVAPPAPDGRQAYARALACYERGAYAQAAEWVEAMPSHDSEARALAARASANLGRLDEARRWCEAAVAADKSNPRLRYLLASVLCEQGRTEEAAAALGQALYLDQDFVLAHFTLGNLYRRQGDARRAERHLDAARKLLARLPPGRLLDEGEGLTAGRLLEIIDGRERIA